jgi:hypothetical protein
MSPTTLATISNQLAIYIDQGAAVQGSEVVPPGSRPVPMDGGILLNLTSCGAPGTGWAFNATSGQLSNLATPGQCATVFACNNSPGSIVFSYDCVTDACNNEEWVMKGATVQSKVVGASQPLCLTGVDPATSPASQLTVDVCDGRSSQQWTVDASSGQLSLASMPPASACLALFTTPAVNLYSKVMKTGEVAIAVLNRGDAAVGPQTVNLGTFSYAPAQGVMVTTVWTNATSGPFYGTFQTEAVASHETLLFLLRLAVGGPAATQEL